MNGVYRKLGQILCELWDAERELIGYQKQALEHNDESMVGAINALVLTLTEASRKMNAVRGDLSCLKDEWNEKEAKATQQFAEPLPKNCLPGSIVWGNKRINLNNVR
jgi:hypothetical protein